MQLHPGFRSWKIMREDTADKDIWLNLIVC